MIYRSDLPKSVEELVFRILLFKLFNKIETWEMLEKELGPLTYSEFAFKRYDQILTKAMVQGQTIYSAAYIMPSGGSLGYEKKHRNHLALIERMISSELPNQLAESSTMEEAFKLVLNYPSIGSFLAFQYVADINYSTVTNFSEMDFVVAGPGAINGIRKCFKDTAGKSDAYIIQLRPKDRIRNSSDSDWHSRICGGKPAIDRLSELVLRSR